MQRRRTLKRWNEQVIWCTERTVFLGFYAARKLMESRKLSGRTIHEAIRLRSYPATGKPVHLMNRHDVDELYDLGNPKQIQRNMRFVANQIVHSYVMAFRVERSKGLRSVYFSSDEHRHRALYEITAAKIAALFRPGGRDYPEWVSMKYNEARRDWDIHARQRPPQQGGA